MAMAAKATTNKFRYYEVLTSTVVRANNATEAIAVASGRRNVKGNVLGSDQWAERITAEQAREFTNES